MAREGLRSRLRSALSSAAETGTEVHVDDTRVRLAHGTISVRFAVAPLPESAAGDYGRAFLVVFWEGQAPPPAASRPTAGIRRLEEELQLARDDLQSTIEDLRAANLEFRFSNEEVTSANEELQAMNEELAGSREELQSLNEELHTSNQQLEDKVAELATANNDLRNLLDSSGIATICLDADMNLRWYTPAATDVMSLRPTDVGRPISEIAMKFSGEPLLARAQGVISSLTPAEDEFQAKDYRWFIRRTIPYMADGGRPDGIIITLTDITELKRAAAAAIEEKQALVESLAARVQERTRELAELATTLSMAEERERQAVAADLHDELAQLLALAKIRLHELLRDPQASPLEKPIEQVTDLLDRADRRTRSLAVQLSNPVLRQFGLFAALESLAEEMQHDYDISVAFQDDGKENKLPPAADVVLYRAVRELLINVAKHADVDRADIACRVEAHAEGQQLTIIVSDNGRGFSPSDLTASGAWNSGMGLRLIRDRLQLLGGKFTISSIPGDGVEAVLSLPLPLSLSLPPGTIAGGTPP
jgi:two-component system CheB/CheR fusion protein